jgi:hypothetical protein
MQWSCVGDRWYDRWHLTAWCQRLPVSLNPTSVSLRGSRGQGLVWLRQCHATPRHVPVKICSRTSNPSVTWLGLAASVPRRDTRCETRSARHSLCRCHASRAFPRLLVNLVVIMELEPLRVTISSPAVISTLCRRKECVYAFFSHDRASIRAADKALHRPFPSTTTFLHHR